MYVVVRAPNEDHDRDKFMELFYTLCDAEKSAKWFNDQNDGYLYSVMRASLEIKPIDTDPG